LARHRAARLATASQTALMSYASLPTLLGRAVLLRAIALAALGPLASLGSGRPQHALLGSTSTTNAPSVYPKGASVELPVEGGTVSFEVSNNDDYRQTIYLSCDYGGSVGGCSVSGSVTVDAYQSASVNVTVSAGGVGGGTVGLTASTNDIDYGWYNVNVTDGRNAPTLVLTPYNGENRNVALCVADCFDGRVSISTPAYTSLDVPRSVTLTYSSATASPRVTVVVDAYDNSTTAPSKMSIRILNPNQTIVTQTNGLQETFFVGGTGKSRLAAQFDASGLATGAYDYLVAVKSYWNDGQTRESSAYFKALVVNESSSPLGAGWMVAGLQRLYVQADNSLVLVEGGGSVARFPVISCPSTCTYSSPVGDFTSVTRRSSWPDNVKWDRRYPDGTTASFFSDGRMAYIQDRFGNRTSFSYDGSGRLSQITDPISQVTTLTYLGVNGTLNAITDPMSRQTTVSIDAARSLKFVQDPALQQPFGGDAIYDASNRLKQWRDRRGGTWNLAYDAAGKDSTSTMPTVAVDGEGNVRPAIAMKSLETAQLVFAGGSFSVPAPRINPDTLRATVTNPRGYVTKYALDRFGDPTRIEEPLNRVTVLNRDVASRVTSSTSPSGHSLTFSYTGPNLTYTYDAFTGRSQNIYYETTYNQDTLTVGDVDTLRKKWSGGKLDSARINSNPWSKFTYDNRGRMLTQKDPAGHQIIFAYAASGQQNVRSITAAGQVENLGYDQYGRLAADTARDGGITRHQYDVINRDTLVIGPIGDTTITRYDALYIASIRDAKGQTYSFARNSLGWVEARSDPSGRADTVRYDRRGNVTWQKNRRGVVATFQYNALDQPTSRAADGQTTTYNVSPVGAFSVASNAESKDSIAFDAAGRPVKEFTWRNGTLYERTSVYDPHDLRTSLTINQPWTATIGYHYNSKLQLDSLTDVVGRVTSLSYDSDFLLTAVGLPTSAGLTVSADHPATHTPSAISYSASAINSVLGADYAYNTSAQLERRISWITETEEMGRQFSYDLRSRLTGYADYQSTGDTRDPSCEPTWIINPNTGQGCTIAGFRSTSDSSAYDYDKVGNRKDSSATLTPGNRLTRFRGDTMAYDADGNLVKRWALGGGHTDTLVWNSLGQLVSVTRDGVTTSFWYDGFGRRARKQAGSSSTTYIWDGDDLLAALDGGGNRVAEYVYYPGVDEPHSIRRHASVDSVFYFATDVPGHVVGLINIANQLVNRYSYAPYGVLQDSSISVANSLRFGARELDAETGLYYLRARYYDPSLGRFISEDPAGLDGGINLYQFSRSNPINRRDPSGKSSADLAKLCPKGTTLTNYKEDDDGNESGSCRPEGGGDHYSQETADAINAVLNGSGAAGGFEAFGGFDGSAQCRELTSLESRLLKAAYRRMKRTGTEEGYFVFRNGKYRTIDGQGIIKTESSITIPNLPKNLRELIHGHFTSGQLSVTDIAFAGDHPGVTVISGNPSLDEWGIAKSGWGVANCTHAK
jgi:RHS repeat-associated protein